MDCTILFKGSCSVPCIGHYIRLRKSQLIIAILQALNIHLGTSGGYCRHLNPSIISHILSQHTTVRIIGSGRSAGSKHHSGRSTATAAHGHNCTDQHCQQNTKSLSLPSLRIDRFAFDVLNKIQEYKKSGLTYAPEAGTQRLRDVINKGVTDDDIFNSIEQALILGWKHIKLYFMIGLPTETYEDLDGIADIAKRIIDLNYKINGPKGGRFNVTVSVSNFVPKADTPFQWEAQNSAEEFEEKHNYLAKKLKIKGVTFNYHDNKTSAYEAVFARGDRRTGRLLYEAHKAGARLDGWTEHFRPEAWGKAFSKSGINADFYTTRKRNFDEVLPWDVIDCGVSKKYLINEAKKAYDESITRDCRLGCTGCGMNRHVNCAMDGILKNPLSKEEGGTDE